MRLKTYCDPEVNLNTRPIAGDYGKEETHMKIVVIGGSGLIGTKLVKLLREKGHEALAASPSSGVNTITGEGLAAALAGRSDCCRLGERALVGGQGGVGILPDLRPQPARGGGPSRRSAPCRALHRRHRPDARQWLFPRQGRPRETDRGRR